jgi:uncharacterized repeat protein (TIGR01451 family)
LGNLEEAFVNSGRLCQVTANRFLKSRFRTLIAAGFTLAMFASLALTLLHLVPAHRVGKGAETASNSKVSPISIPLFFEPNQGQVDPRVRFLARGAGYGLFLTADEAVLSLRPGRADADSVIRMRLSGSNPAARVSGADPLPGKSNYLIGNDRTKWHRGIPQFGRVNYENVYPGIALTYYGSQGRLEYDFRVAPGADPNAIALSFDGAAARIEDGELALATDQGEIRFQAPVIYQQIGDERKQVEGRYRQLAANKVGFELGAYDRSKELVIDPTLSYSTFLGGSKSESLVHIAVDSGGNVYVSGSTTGGFPIPTSPAPFQPSPRGPQNLFIAKLTPGSSPVIFATYIGSSGTDFAAGVAVDSNLNVYVAGTSLSAGSDYPTTATAFQQTASGGKSHGFISRLDANGSVLQYSTYLAGNGQDNLTGLAVDTSQNAYVTGTTTSTDAINNGFPANESAYQQTPNGTTQFFASKVNTNGSGPGSMLYSTYFGGGNPANGTAIGGGIAVDASNNLYFTGSTTFLPDLGSNGEKPFPLLNAARTTIGGQDAIAVKLNPNVVGTASLTYSTYLGGSGVDDGNAIAVDTANNTYVTGETFSTDFFVPSGLVAPFQAGNAGGGDAFIVKIGNPAGTNTIFPITYFTYLGGGGADIGKAIVADSIQGAHVTGSTASGNLPVVNAFQAYGGNNDAFVGLISTTGAAGNYLTYLGGSGFDEGTGIALDSNNDSSPTYVGGDTASSDFPVVNPLQVGIAGPQDAFISQIGASSSFSYDPAVSPNPNVSPNPGTAGSNVTFTFTFKNNGPDSASNVIFSGSLPATGFTFASASASPGGACPAPINNKVLCQVGNIASQAQLVVTVVLVPITGTTSLSVTPTLIVNSNQISTFPGITVPITDFSITAAPPSQEVAAGNPTQFTVTVTPQGAYANTVTVTQTGLPGASTGTFTSTSITFPGTGGAQSTILNIATTARPVPVGNLRHGSTLFYATWIPIGGLSLLGLGVSRRRRRWLVGMLLAFALSILVLQPACSSSNSTPPPTGGTPPGIYTITITGSSGQVSHNVRVQLKVD